MSLRRPLRGICLQKYPIAPTDQGRPRFVPAAWHPPLASAGGRELLTVRSRCFKTEDGIRKTGNQWERGSSAGLLDKSLALAKAAKAFTCRHNSTSTAFGSKRLRNDLFLLQTAYEETGSPFSNNSLTSRPGFIFITISVQAASKPTPVGTASPRCAFSLAAFGSGGVAAAGLQEQLHPRRVFPAGSKLVREDSTPGNETLVFPQVEEP